MEGAFIKAPETIAEATAALVRVVRELLGEEAVRVLTLRHIDGMSEGEIARQVGVNQSVISRKLSTAREKLRRVGLLPPAWDIGKK